MTHGTYTLLHGFMQSPAAWDSLAQSLPAHAQVQLPVLLGHEPLGPALSGPALSGHALLGHGTERALEAESFLDEVERLARELASCAPSHLVGYSLGARVALVLASRHPALFHRVTLIGVHPGIDDDAEREGRVMVDEARAKSLEEQGLEAFVDAWEREPLFATQSRVDQAMRARHRAMRLSHDALGIAQSLRVLGLGKMPPHGDLLSEIELPIDLVIGAEDVRFRSIALRMADALPRCRVHVIPHTGHDVPLEAPAALARVIRQEWP